jgi:predicted AlkP superfamily phosphohydrolase/phosphomutase
VSPSKAGKEVRCVDGGPNGPAEVMPALSHGWWKGWRGPKPLTADFRDRGRGFNVLSVCPIGLMSKILRTGSIVLACAAAGGATFLYRNSSKSGQRPATRVVLLGFDGADPDIVDILVAQGKLPSLARLMRTGSYGRLRSFSPTKSAILWTSVATGKTMVKHGVVDWTYVNRMRIQVPYQDSSRKVKTYWEILSERGIRTGTINWWMSYPPPPISHGYIVSNAFRHTSARQTVHPPQLYDALSPLRLDDVQAHAEMQRLGLADWKAENATVPIGAVRNAVDAYWLYVSQDLSVDRVSDHMWTNHPVDVFSTYFRLVDVTSHFAVHFTDPKLYEETVALEMEGRLTPKARARMDTEFARVVSPIYRLMDQIVGKYMDRMDGRTLLIVCSDHGFDFFRRGYAHAHRAMSPPDGVLFLAGPGVRKGGQVEQPTLFDIAPTILHAMGQPLASDMDGTVPRSAFDEGYFRRYAARTIPSYESKERQMASSSVPAEVDKEVLEDLKTLGYVGAGGESPAKASPSPEVRR